MADASKVTPEEVRRRMSSGASTLLVCAYEDADKCRQAQLDGAIHMPALNARLATLPKDTELVFYCA
jgi:hypothetical protein